MRQENKGRRLAVLLVVGATENGLQLVKPIGRQIADDLHKVQRNQPLDPIDHQRRRVARLMKTKIVFHLVQHQLGVVARLDLRAAPVERCRGVLHRSRPDIWSAGSILPYSACH